MAITPLVALVRKDLQLFFSDRRAMIMSFAAPIAIASFFGAVLGGTSRSENTPGIPVVVADNDRGTIAQGILANLRADKTLDVTLNSADSARILVRLGKATVGIVIPADFGDRAGRAMFGGQDKPELELIYDPSHSAELGMVRGMLTGHVMEAVSKEMFSGSRGRDLVDEQLRAIDSSTLPAEQKRLVREILAAAQNLQRSNAVTGAGGVAALTVPYTVNEQAAVAVGVPYNGYAHSFAGMGVQFLLFAAIDLGVGILLERQRGLWKRLRSAPISRFTVLGGKALSGTVITLMTLLVSFAFAMIVFKVRITGSVPGFFAVAVATALMAATFGILIASLGKTPGTTRGMASLSVLLMVMLGGAWIPSFLFPGWLQKATIVIPARWAVDGLEAMTWRGVGLSGAVLPTAVLMGFAALFGGLALMRFNWEEA